MSIAGKVNKLGKRKHFIPLMQQNLLKTFETTNMKCNL